MAKCKFGSYCFPTPSLIISEAFRQYLNENKVKLILQTEKFKSSTLLDLLRYENSIIEITRFGYTEPLKNKIDQNKLTDVVELFDNYLDIIFKGKNKFWMSISTTSEGIMMVGGGLELKKTQLNQINELIEFIEKFSINEQLLFAYMCNEDEFDEKHKILEGNGVSWKGVSQWDFLEFLPGVH